MGPLPPRRLENWLAAYEQYAIDNYCPDIFHKWVGLSVLAGALERKVWLRSSKAVFIPNIYILLVTYAGIGKSTAITRGVDFLERLKEEVDPEFKIIDEQTTEANLVKLMEVRQEFALSETKRVFHSTGFFHASEASASALQNTHGTFTSTITGFYDCPKVFRKSTLTNGQIELRNVCFNMLAGATFDYLKTLVNESSVMGGFASRNIYVVNKERLIRTPKWNEFAEADPIVEELFEDLKTIHALSGQFRPTKAFIDAWEAFQPESDRQLAALQSPRLESLAARKSLNTTKVAMLLSVAESNDLVLDLHHWEQAMALMDDVAKDYPYILSQGAIAAKDTQSSITQVIGQTLKSKGSGLTRSNLKAAALRNGNDADRIARTIDMMIGANWISVDSDDCVHLIVDPDTYL